MNASDKKTWYVQPADGTWIENKLHQQNSRVLMTDAQAQYMVMAGVLGPDMVTVPVKDPAEAEPAPAAKADAGDGKKSK